jgi:hypothetical protein
MNENRICCKAFEEQRIHLLIIKHLFCRHVCLLVLGDVHASCLVSHGIRVAANLLHPRPGSRRDLWPERYILQLAAFKETDHQ